MNITQFKKRTKEQGEKEGEGRVMAFEEIIEKREEREDNMLKRNNKCNI